MASYDWQQYVNVDSRGGRLVDYMVARFPWTDWDRRNLRRSFEYSGITWDKRIEDHAPIYIYEFQGAPVGWFNEAELAGYDTSSNTVGQGYGGPRTPPPEIVG